MIFRFFKDYFGCFEKERLEVRKIGRRKIC